MNLMQAMSEYWSDPETLVVPAGQPDRTIAWLAQQTPDTWHRVVATWNYDHGDQVLSWILNQDACDRGTAVCVFLTEGLGHWLSDAARNEHAFNDKTHVCRIVMDNWHRYTKADLNHGYNGRVPDDAMSEIARRDTNGFFEGTPLAEILSYQGTRDAQSKYASQDGKIMIDFDHWAEANGVSVK